nr:hypothetical protein CFP56_14486 [Quercus suber]
MRPYYFYVYYDGEAYINDSHGLSYRGLNLKQTLIEVKCGIHMRKLKRKIMSTLGLDKDPHDISIVFRAPQQLYASRAGEQESVPVTIVYPSVTAEMSLPYNVGPRNAVAMDNIETAEVLGSIHTREGRGYTEENADIQTHLDEAIEMDDTQDVYEEFIDNDVPEDNLKFLDELQVENNVDACPNPNPNPDWFTSNTWDNIHDPSPSLETCLMSWRPGDEPSKGKLFLNKAVV